ncbi:MAG: GGDEF domain-containing protein [bacterium]
MASRKRAEPTKQSDWSSLSLYLNMRKRAPRDPLTELFHRDRLLDELDLVMLMARSHKHPFALAIIDLDDLKRINVAHKRQTGDRLLAETADLLRRSVRVMDFACRSGGDEFAVILPKSNVAGAKTFADRLLHKIRENVFCKSTHKLHITASAGIVVLSPSHTILSSLTLLDRAKEERDKAKKLGGGQYSLASEPGED